MSGRSSANASRYRSTESSLYTYPRAIRHKEFDLGIYELLSRPTPAAGFELDVGINDDLFVRRFHAKEAGPGGVTFRWTSNLSYVSVLGTRPDQQLLTLSMAAGGRPAAAGPAEVEVSLNGRPLGTVTVQGAFTPYRFAIPSDLAAAIAESDDAAQLQLVTRVWKPAAVLGGNDSRELGVMVDRIEIR